MQKIKIYQAEINENILVGCDYAFFLVNIFLFVHSTEHWKDNTEIPCITYPG